MDSQSISIDTQMRQHLSRKISSIATDASEAKQDTEIPKILSELSQLFSSHNKGTHSSFVVEKIWESELIPACVTCLNCDYSKVDGGWKVAANMAQFLYVYFTTLSSIRSSNLESAVATIHDELIPSLLENSILLCRRIQTRYEMMAATSLLLKESSNQKQVLLSAFKSVIGTIEQISNKDRASARSILENPYLLKMMFTDEPDTLVQVVDFISRTAQACGKEQFAKIPESKFYALLDEMVYKLSEFDSPNSVAAAVTRALVDLTNIYPKTGEAFFTRYKGIRFIISHWSGKGFEQDQKRLLLFLDSQTKQMKEMEKFHRAARVIQRVYRKFIGRKHLSQMALSRKDNEFEENSEKEKRDYDRLRELEENDVKLQMSIQTHQAIRKTHEKRLYLTEQVNAKQIDKYLQQTENEAALKIQTKWRGFKIRKEFSGQQDALRKVKAAIAIQRWVRRCLAKVDQKKMLRGKKLWTSEGISEQRRAELQQIIQEYKERYIPKQVSRSEEEYNFNKTQDMLKQQIQMSRIRAKSDVRRETLLAKLEIDSQLVGDAPSLDDDITDDVINRYLNPTAPVALSGKNAHLNSLTTENLPWYRKLHLSTEPDMEDIYSIRTQIERQIDKIVKY